MSSCETSRVDIPIAIQCLHYLASRHSSCIASFIEFTPNGSYAKHSDEPFAMKLWIRLERCPHQSLESGFRRAALVRRLVVEWKCFLDSLL